MSLIFSAIVPHPPILIPQIGKENTTRLEATQKAYDKLAAEMAKDEIDTIIIISPHGVVRQNSFTINLNPEFEGNLKEFGDFSRQMVWSGDVGLAYKIRESLETKTPLQLISEKNLDYGTFIPLLLLTEKLPQVKIIPFYYSGLSDEAHFKFGQLVKNQLFVSKKNIAVIASGDLSHRLSKDAPAGYSPRGKKFDKKLIDLLLKNRGDDIINFDPGLVAEAGECGLKSILILLGILHRVKYKPRLLSYEAPFGVGYLVMNLEL